MSRQNKVNPGMYTQRGRLTQDDAARELRKQSAIGSAHTWQPVDTRARPPLAPAGDAAADTERSAGSETMVETSAPPNAKAEAAKAKTATTRKSKRTTGNARTAKAVSRADKPTTTKPARKAMLARNVGGRRAAPSPTTKRRKR